MKATWAVAVFAALVWAIPATAQDQFGAVAIDEATGDTGYAVAQPSQDAALEAAVQDCGSAGCVAVNWFGDACGAIAIGNGGYGASWGESRDAAAAYAMDACERYAEGCRVDRAVCMDD